MDHFREPSVMLCLRRVLLGDWPRAMRWLLLKIISFLEKSKQDLNIPGEARGPAAALRLKKVRPMAATEKQSMKSNGTTCKIWQGELKSELGSHCDAI